MKKGLAFIFAGVGFFVLGGLLVPSIFGVSFFFIILHSTEGMESFLAPGQAEVHVEKAGRYYLWNNYETTFGGRTYSNSSRMPNGVRINIEDGTGQKLVFHSSNGISMSSKGGEKRSIGYVELEAPGTVRIEVSGEMDKRVISFGPNVFSKLIGMMLVSLAFTGSMLLLAVSCFIIGIVRVVKASREENAAKS